MQLKPSRFVRRTLAAALALTLGACGQTITTPEPPLQPTAAPAQPTPAPAQPTIAPAPPTTAPAQPTLVPALPTAAPVQPTAVPPPNEWTNYIGGGGRWSINYPANTLTPLDMGGGLIIFISQDRGYFVGVDSRPGAQEGDAALRALAVEALSQIYGSRPATIAPLAQTDAPWQAGVTFTTALGSEGTAAYYHSDENGVSWAYGMIYGYKLAGKPAWREALFQTLATLQLAPPTADDPVSSPQGPYAAATTLTGLLDALMRGDDPTPFLAQPLIEAAAGGQPYTWLLGLSAEPLLGYSVVTPSQPTDQEGSVLVTGTLDYPGRSETRIFNVVAEGAAWKVYSTVVP